MKDRIVIHCPTQNEWDKVLSKARRDGYDWCEPGDVLRIEWVEYEEKTCLALPCNGGHLQYSPKDYWENAKYTIISAAEYLNEGGKDMSELTIKEAWKRGLIKKGERVETTGSTTMSIDSYTGCISDVNKSGESFTIARDNGNKGCGFDGGYLVYASNENIIRFLNNKTQTTKENNMELNSSIRTVLVEENGATFETVEKFQKVFGSEIAENFTGAMILRKNIKTYNDEIKRLDDIEAKRLEKEEKDK